MQPITAVVDQELRWQQPSGFHPRYALQAGGALIATLAFRSSWGTLATAERADGCWTFKRVGFWQTRATVRLCASDTDLGAFQNNTWRGGGTLTLLGGPAFQLTTNTWQTRLEVVDAQEQPVLRYATTGWMKQGAGLSIAPAARTLSALPWLAVFGWYVVVMMYRDSAATAAMIAPVS
jgi:hypothetical protein